MLVLLSGTAGSQLLQLLSLPILSRIYTPADVGTASIFVAFVAVWSKLTALRYDSALLIVEDELIGRLVAICVAFVLITSPLGGVAIAYLIEFGVLGFDSLPSWTYLLTIAVCIGLGSFATLRSWALRRGLVGPIRNATLLRGAGGVATRLGGGFLGHGIDALLVAELVAAWFSLYGLAKRFYADARDFVGGWSRDLVRKICLKYRTFPTLELPSVLVDTVALWLPVPLVAQSFGAKGAGIYVVAHRLVAMPTGQIVVSIADVYQMRFAAAVRAQNFDEARQLTWKLIRRLAAGGLIPFAFVMAIAPFVMDFVLGSDWSEVGLLMSTIVPWMYCSLVVSTVSRLLLVLRRQELKLIYDIVALGVVVGAFWLGGKLELSLAQNVLVLSVGHIFAFAIYLLLLLVAIRRLPVDVR